MSFGAAERSPDKPVNSFSYSETDKKNKKAELIPLINKRTKRTKYFKLFLEKNLEFLSRKNATEKILDFDMSKLELEYDYETDEE